MKTYKREIETHIEPWLNREEICIIIGARQVGKTSLMKRLQEKQINQTLFFTLEDFEILELLNDSPKNLINLVKEEGYDLNQKITIFIDEIQYLSDPSHFLKYIFDEYKGIIKLIVSGSSAFYINETFRDSLAGRKKIFHLFPLSFSEYLDFTEQSQFIKLLADYKSCTQITKEKIQLSFDDYFQYGGYPKVVLENNKNIKKELLKELLNSYLKKDILEYKIKYPEKLYALYKILSLQSGNIINKNELSQTIGLSIQAINHYIDLLQKSFQFTFLRPFSKNIRKELVKNPKVFFSDTGLRNSLENNFEVLDFRVDKGNLFETMVLHSLQKSENDEIFFWRTADGKEVDFILAEKKEMIEVTYTDRNKIPKYFKLLEEKYDFKGRIITRENIFQDY